ncbi:MAG: zinc-ribbon domain-containing protein, partial [Pseudomonadales bacterium]
MDYRPDNTQEFSSVTQCPYCHTAFHVGLAQLDAAAGRVRCGGCLRVFNAKEHFLVEQKRLFDDEPGMETGDEASIPETEESADSFFDVDLFGAEITDDDEPVILGSFNHYSGISIPRHAILDHKVDAFRQENYEHASAKEVL